MSEPIIKISQIKEFLKKGGSASAETLNAVKAFLRAEISRRKKVKANLGRPIINNSKKAEYNRKYIAERRRKEKGE